MKEFQSRPISPSTATEWISDNKNKQQLSDEQLQVEQQVEHESAANKAKLMLH